MTGFRAVTVGGTVYEYDGHRVKITPKDGYFTVIHPWKMKVVRHEDIPEGLTYAELHKYIHTLPEAEIPEVGASFYVVGKDEWRLSSKITKVEEL